MRIYSHILAIGMFAGLALTIEYAVSSGMISPAVVARPSEVVNDISNYFPGQIYFDDLVGTTVRSLMALVISCFLGVIIGTTIHRLNLLREVGKFTVDFLRSIPATALVPLFLVFFGIGDASKVAAGVFSGSLAVALATIIGFQNLDSDRRQVANLVGLGGWKRLWYYELAEAAPTLWVGVRTAASLCLVLVIVAEMFIGSDGGLGRIIMDSRYGDNIPSLYGAILVSGIIGFGVNKALEAISSE